MTSALHSILLYAAIALAMCACGRAKSAVEPWSLADTEVCLRCGEVYRIPFTGGSADYTLHNPAPDAAEVTAVGGGDAGGQALVLRGKSKGTSQITVRDNRADRSVCIVLRVVDPYFALLGSVHTDPGRQDHLLAWDTNLYLNSDGRFILTTFTDGLPIKPALIARGTYRETPAGDSGGYDITIAPDGMHMPPQTYAVAAGSPLAAMLESWDLAAPVSDLDMCELPNRAGSRGARYWLSTAERLPSHLRF